MKLLEEKKIKFLNSEINYKQFKKKSNKKTILILHGWGGSSNSWIKFSEILSEKGYNIIIPDLPGFGKTGIYKIFTLDDYAEVIEEFVKKINLENFILWGHSNGGAISIKIINRGKLKIDFLVLNNSAGIRNDKKRNLKRKFFNKVSKIIKKISFIKKEKLLFVRKIFYKVIGSRDYLKAEKNPFLKQTYLNMISSDLFEEIKNIKIKTFLIWGENDTYTPLSDGKKMSKNITNSDLFILKKQTHGIHLKNPQLLSETFLNAVDLYYFK